MSKLKLIVRWSSRLLIGVVALVVLLVIVRAVLQERIRIAQAIQSPPGIDSMEAVDVGGIRQWIHIRGRDRRNPVLLYLHGGPGTPMMPFGYAFQTYLEGAFTVVEWDQRGAGKTYFANDPAVVTPTISYERMQADALEMVNLLRKRFDQPKIFVIGHSWGSMLGLPLVHAHPELFYAYVGTGQVINARENERTGYEHALAEARRRGDQEAIKALVAIAPYPDPVTGIVGDKMNVIRHWEFRYGFALYGKTDLYREMLKTAIISPDYSLHDFYYFVAEPSHDVLDRWIDGFDADETWARFPGAHHFHIRTQRLAGPRCSSGAISDYDLRSRQGVLLGGKGLAFPDVRTAQRFRPNHDRSRSALCPRSCAGRQPTVAVENCAQAIVRQGVHG